MPKPPIKYVGGKGKLIKEIERYIPEDTTLIVEPFCGSAALSFSNNMPFLISDSSEELITFYRVLMLDSHYCKMLKYLKVLEETHNESNFLHYRSADRSSEFINASISQRAARYYYIIYAGFNGLYRVNKKGQCNTPWGKRDFKVDIKRLEGCRDHLKKYCVSSSSSQFDDTRLIERAINDSRKPFVFIDPPYYGEGVFIAYTKEGFNKSHYKRLVKYVKFLNDKEIPFLLTNTYCEEVVEMFSDYNIEKVTTKYSIAADGERRGETFEAFISNVENHG